MNMYAFMCVFMSKTLLCCLSYTELGQIQYIKIKAQICLVSYAF